MREFHQLVFSARVLVQRSVPGSGPRSVVISWDEDVGDVPRVTVLGDDPGGPSPGVRVTAEGFRALAPPPSRN